MIPAVTYFEIGGLYNKFEAKILLKAEPNLHSKRGFGKGLNPLVVEDTRGVLSLTIFVGKGGSDFRSINAETDAPVC